MRGQIARLDQVAVEMPKLFTGSEGSDELQILIERVLMRFARGFATVPKAVHGLEAVLVLRHARFQHYFVDLQRLMARPKAEPSCEFTFGLNILSS